MWVRYLGDTQGRKNLNWSWCPKASHPALHVREDTKVGHILPAELVSLWAPTTLEEVQGH